MHKWMIPIFAAVVCMTTGCTHMALERRTVKQASTLTDLQYQQALDNLAMFSCNKDALPWHLKLKGGLVQVADQGNAGFTANLASGTTDMIRDIFSPSVAGQRGILGQWDVDPTVEADDLGLLRLAYLKALNPADPDLVPKIDKAICDLSVRYDILPEDDTLIRIFLSNNVKEKINDAIERICMQLDDVDETKMKKLLEDGHAKCGDKLDKDVLKNYPTSLKKELSLRLLDLLQMQTAVNELLKPPPELTPGRVTYSSLQPFTIPTGTVGVAGARPERFTDEEGKKLLPKPLSAAEQILFALHLACDPGYIPPAWTHEPSGRNVGLVAQAGDRIERLQDLVKDPKFQQPWLCCGNKHDVPKCACYVGHYCKCGRECYVWVMPEQMAFLREFTLTVLTLAPNDKQDISSVTNPGRGAAFSPSFGGR